MEPETAERLSHELRVEKSKYQMAKLAITEQLERAAIFQEQLNRANLETAKIRAKLINISNQVRESLACLDAVLDEMGLAPAEEIRLETLVPTITKALLQAACKVESNDARSEETDRERADQGDNRREPTDGRADGTERESDGSLPAMHGPTAPDETEPKRA